MKIQTALTTVVAVALVAIAAESVQAQSLANNLFQQYTAQGAGQVNADMYPAPHWVPRHVGHTYNTYQPLMPHEMMYQHSRNYYNYYGPAADYYTPQYGLFRGIGGGCGGCGSAGGALNKTTVRWQAGCNHMAPLPGNMWPFAGAQYSWARYWYCVQNGGGNCGRFLPKLGLGGGCFGGSCASTCDSGSCDGEIYGDVIGDSCASGGCTAKLTDQDSVRR